MFESSIHILTVHNQKHTFKTLIEMEFIAEQLQIGLPEKVIICLSWFLIETVGNGMLTGSLITDCRFYFPHCS